jgi:hypothetical protein
MSHFAEIDNNGKVLRVIVADQNFINSGAVGDAFRWVQTSYNANFRGRFAGPDFTYDKVNDVFIEKQPYPSWTLDSDFEWQPPTSRPDGNVIWDEDTLSWTERV